MQSERRLPAGSARPANGTVRFADRAAEPPESGAALLSSAPVPTPQASSRLEAGAPPTAWFRLSRDDAVVPHGDIRRTSTGVSSVADIVGCPRPAGEQEIPPGPGSQPSRRWAKAGETPALRRTPTASPRPKRTVTSARTPAQEVGIGTGELAHRPAPLPSRRKFPSPTTRSIRGKGASGHCPRSAGFQPAGRRPARHQPLEKRRSERHPLRRGGSARMPPRGRARPRSDRFVQTVRVVSALTRGPVAVICPLHRADPRSPAGPDAALPTR